MYQVPYFKENDRQQILHFVQQHPFAMLIGCRNNIPVATQVPLLIEERESGIIVRGHIMKGTDHYQALRQHEQVLCVFTGAHTYVSASWYTQPQSASTWNYMSVHVRGRISFTDENGLLQILEETTSRFENNPDSPAAFHRLPEAYVHRLVQAIAGFEIEVQQMDAIFKLSQNRDEASYQNIIQHLQSKDAAAQIIAEEMENRKAHLFK